MKIDPSLISKFHKPFALSKVPECVKDKFEYEKKKRKITADSQLIGETLEKGLFGILKTIPVATPIRELEKGILVSGSVGSGVAETKKVFIYEQLKAGMGGLYMPAYEDHSDIVNFYSLMDSFNRDDIVFINGVQAYEEGLRWDIFKDGTNDEIIQCLSRYISSEHQSYIALQAEELLQYLIPYLKSMSCVEGDELNHDNILDRMQGTGCNFIFKDKDERTEKAALKEYLDIHSGSMHQNDRFKTLNTVILVIKDSIRVMNDYFSTFLVRADDMDFEKAIIQKKVIYAFSPCSMRRTEFAEAFQTIVLSRYLRALDELSKAAPELYKSFVLIESLSGKKSDILAKYIFDLMEHKYTYGIYVTRDINSEYENEDTKKILNLFSRKYIMKDHEPQLSFFEDIEEATGLKLNLRDIASLRPGEGFYIEGERIRYVKGAYIQLEALEQLNIYGN